MLKARKEEAAKETALKKAITENNKNQIIPNIPNGDINYQFAASRSTALMYAVEAGNLDVVKFLLQSGASISKVNKDDKTALNIAYNKNNKEIILLLSTEKLCDLIKENTPASYLTIGTFLKNLEENGYSADAIANSYSITNKGNKPWQVAQEAKNWKAIQQYLMQYLLTNKYNANFLEELKEFTQVITQQSSNDELVREFWHNISNNQENIIETGNKRLALLMHLLPKALKVTSNERAILDPRIANIAKIEVLISKFLAFNGITWDKNYEELPELLKENKDKVATHLHEQISNKIEGNLVSAISKSDIDSLAGAIVKNNLSPQIIKSYVKPNDETTAKHYMKLNEINYVISGDIRQQLSFLDELLLAINQEYITRNKFNSLPILYPYLNKIEKSQLNIIQIKKVEDTNKDASDNSKPDEIMLILKKIDIFGKEIIYKLDQKLVLASMNLLKWQDLNLLDDYYKKTIELTLDQYKVLLDSISSYQLPTKLNSENSNILNNQNIKDNKNNVETVISILSEHLEEDQLAELKLNELWIDSRVKYLTLLGRNIYELDELTWKVENHDKIIGSLKRRVDSLPNYDDLKKEFEELKDNFSNIENKSSELEGMLNDLDQVFLEEVTRINDIQNRASELNQKQEEALESFGDQLKEQIVVTVNNKKQYEGLLTGMRSSQPGQIEEIAKLWQAVKNLQEAERHNSNNNGNQSGELDDQISNKVKIDDLAEKVLFLQPFIDNIKQYEQIIKNHEQNEVRTVELTALLSDPNKAYEKSFYLSLVQKLNAVYLATTVVKTGIVGHQQTGMIGNLGNILQSLGVHTPVVGLAVHLSGKVLTKLDNTMQGKMLERFANLASGAVEMDNISKTIAFDLTTRLEELDMVKIAKPDSFKERFLEVLKVAIDSIDNVFSNNHNNQGMQQELLIQVGNVIASNAQSALHISITEEQRGKKDAAIVAAKIISKIYSGEISTSIESNAPSLTSKPKFLIDLIGVLFSKYSSISTNDQSAVQPMTNIAEFIAMQVVKKGNEKAGNGQELESKHIDREEAFIEKFAEILSIKDQLTKKLAEASANIRDEFIDKLATTFNKEHIFKISKNHFSFTNKLQFGIDKEFSKHQEDFMQRLDKVLTKVISESKILEISSTENDNHMPGINSAFSVYHAQPIYRNELLNHQEFGEIIDIAKNSQVKAEAINNLIDLCEDQEIAEQILQAIDEFGTKQVLEILFDNKQKIVKANQEREAQITELENYTSKTQDEKTLEAITKIESVIGKEALAELNGFYQYGSTALSNNPLSGSATKVIQVMSDLVNNFEEWLDLSAIYEDNEIENQITTMLTQLEVLLEFVASGHSKILPLPSRYPGSEPDYDFGDGSSGGKDNNRNNNNDQADINNIDFSILLVGNNSSSAIYDN